ncbi:MAG: hypothetical protein NE327_13870 [Lentisphaeraceae bacterium]|nr:hypothetical protein [Lentisphaeraceae bacterium]
MKLHFERSSDIVFFKKFLKLIEQDSPQLSQVNLTVQTFQFHFEDHEKIAEIKERITTGKEKIISCNSDLQNSCEYRYKFSRLEDSLFDTLNIYGGRNNSDIKPNPETYTFLYKLFKFEDPAILELNKFDSINNNIIATTIKRTQDLEAAAERLIIQTTDKQKELNDKFQDDYKKLYTDLEKEKKKNSTEIELLKQRYDEEHQLKLDEYLKKNDDLTKRETALLNDSSRDARRQLQETISNIIDKHSNVELSESTNSKKMK